MITTCVKCGAVVSVETRDEEVVSVKVAGKDLRIAYIV